MLGHDCGLDWSPSAWRSKKAFNKKLRALDREAKLQVRRAPLHCTATSGVAGARGQIIEQVTLQNIIIMDFQRKAEISNALTSEKKKRDKIESRLWLSSPRDIRGKKKLR